MTVETTRSIADWNRDTFGGHAIPSVQFDRMMQEVRELWDLRDAGFVPYAKTRMEIADVAICLHVLAAGAGEDLNRLVDEKMAINRTREWHSAGDGTGYHVKKSPLEGK